MCSKRRPPIKASHDVGFEAVFDRKRHRVEPLGDSIRLEHAVGPTVRIDDIDRVFRKSRPRAGRR